MSDKNLAYLTLATAAIGTIVICVLAYRLNSASSALGDIQKDPVNGIRNLIGV